MAKPVCHEYGFILFEVTTAFSIKYPYISNGNVRVFDAKSGRDLKEYKAVLMTNWFSHASIRKDIALSLALYFKANNVPCLNSESLQSRSTSKLSQMVLAALNDIT